MESALEAERQEVLALLEGRTVRRAPSPSRRSMSPAVALSPIRSMLDIDDAPPRRSMLDIAPGPTQTRNTSNASSLRSPMQSTFDSASTAGASLRSPGLPPVSPNRARNPEHSYQFEMLPTIEAHALPKRVAQGGKKKPKGAMASVYGGGTERLAFAKDRGRHNSTTGILGKANKSMSPSSRISGGRSGSPGSSLNTNSMNLMPTPNKYITDSGKVVDMTLAYRRLSDAALLRSGGDLAALPTRKDSDPSNGTVKAPDGGVRLTEDYYAHREDAVESSDEESADTSEGEGWGKQKIRGRRRTRKGSEGQSRDSDNDRKPPRSLLAAAEEERKEVTSTYKVRSLLDPVVPAIKVDGAKLSNKKTGVFPNTNFDQAPSGVSTPVTSDTEADISEIRHAQQMALKISNITNMPDANRCMRTIVRGEYRKFQQEAEEGLRRQRLYFVSTDLSEEAAYALEWTIGTVLRDGDTLLAMYAVDQETGIGLDSQEASESVGQAHYESLLLAKTLAESAPGTTSSPQSRAHSPAPVPSPLRGLASTDAATDGPEPANMSRAERDRWNATQQMSARIIKLLRKTRLQVRVVVEVFHCKSPKHMICEVIDTLEPTLVILGSRGRSQLKGVLLGSFSNYIVTKSSVPVMVARKRLRKHSKYKRTNLRLSNNLISPDSRLVNAKID